MKSPLKYLNSEHLWNVVAASLNQGSTLVANLLLAHMLIPEDFGRYGAIHVSFTAIASASQLSAWISAAHFSGRYRDSAPHELGRVFFVIRTTVVAMAGVVAIALVIFRSEYATTVLQAPGAALEVGLAAGYIVFASLNSYQIGVLVGLDALRGYARSSVFQGVIAIGLLAIGGYAGGVAGALLGLSVASMFRWALTRRLVSAALERTGIALQRDGLKSAISEVVRFSIPASIGALTYMASLWFTVNAIIRQPEGYFLSAVYVVCMNLKTLVLFVPQQTNNVSIAHLTRYRVSSPDDYKAALVWNIGLVTLVTAISATVVGVAAGGVLSLYGGDFAVGRVVLQLMMVAAVTEAVGYALTQHFSSRGAMWTTLFAASLPRDATVVFGVTAFLPTYGLEAVPWVFAASWIVYIGGLSLAVWWARVRVEHDQRF